ncbi:MAG: alanine racemase [Candidatus Delongbacteria bacterium]|nr:alanine racemase [Candidatus Delongbacteria bacterium]
MLDGYSFESDGSLPLRPTRVQVDLQALTRNFARLARASGLGPAGLYPVVKANAYGHGILPVSQALEAAGAGGLAVGFLEEGILLRRAGLRLPILVMGGLVDYQIREYLDHDLEFTVSSLHKAEQIQAVLSQDPELAGRRAPVHLKVDVDMERIGVHAANAPAFIEKAAGLDRLEIRGVYSHLANADSADRRLLEQPLAVFLELESRCRGLLPAGCRWHLGNSLGCLRLARQSAGRLELARPGLLLYGVWPEQGMELELPELEPVLGWTSRVVYYKGVAAGQGISYGHRYRPGRDTRVVTVPVGYGDGYRRAMSGKAQVLIRGRRYPVAGSICMDQLMVDLGPDGTAYNGDEVVLVGRQGQQEIRIEELASWADTIPWEILTGISQRVPRFSA